MENLSAKGLMTIYTAIFAVIISSLIFSLVIQANGLFYYLVMPLMACVFFGKFIIGMLSCQGWKVYNKKMILGLPVGLFLFYLIILSLLLGMMFLNIGMELSAAQKNINVFLFNAFIGVLASLIAWFVGIKNWMAGLSEYDAIKYFKEKGYSDKKVQELIYKFKNLGAIYSELSKDN